MAIVTSKSRPKQQVTIRDSSHPAAFNKVVCPKCKLGYAVKEFHSQNKFTCDRCGTTFTVGNL